MMQPAVGNLCLMWQQAPYAEPVVQACGRMLSVPSKRQLSTPGAALTAEATWMPNSRSVPWQTGAQNKGRLCPREAASCRQLTYCRARRDSTHRCLTPTDASAAQGCGSSRCRMLADLQ